MGKLGRTNLLTHHIIAGITITCCCECANFTDRIRIQTNDRFTLGRFTLFHLARIELNIFFTDIFLAQFGHARQDRTERPFKTAGLKVHALDHRDRLAIHGRRIENANHISRRRMFSGDDIINFFLIFSLDPKLSHNRGRARCGLFDRCHNRCYCLIAAARKPQHHGQHSDRNDITNSVRALVLLAHNEEQPCQSEQRTGC